MSEVLTAHATAAGAEFSAEQWGRIDEIIAAHQGRPGALIPVLEKIQDVTAYLPESVQRRVAAGLGLPLSQVYGVVTFYSFFTMKPRGKHKVRVCLGTACHVAGGTEVLAGFMQKLDCEAGEMSRDGVFSLDVVRCLGACGLAPVVEVDKKTFSGVRPSQIDAILRRYRSGDGQAEAAADAAAGSNGGQEARERALAAAAATAANVAGAPGGECKCGQAHASDAKTAPRQAAEVAAPPAAQAAAQAAQPAAQTKSGRTNGGRKEGREGRKASGRTGESR